MTKQLMLGNMAVARGLYEAGVRVCSSYPGTPSTEITEYLAQYDEVYAEWAPNEKVAAEVAIGASIAGARAVCCMKHVGLNVAADPLYTVAYTGVNGGLVVVVADDPGMHSSQNEQDSRFHARGAHIPMLEPSDSEEAKAFTLMAFEMSEKYDTPVILRMTTRVSHAQSQVTLGERQALPLKPYVKNMGKYVMMPGPARARHQVVETREKQLSRDADSLSINRIEMNSPDIGVICSGLVYQYVKDALPSASVLKLGLVYPLPDQLLKNFAAKVKKLYVIEELEPFIETYVKSLGIACTGKELFSLQGELSATVIREQLGLAVPPHAAAPQVPGRPPVLCPGCPHRGTFYVLGKLGVTVSGDIGCYTLGAVAPLSAMDACICMGASVGMAHGMEKAMGQGVRPTVAVIGDSTFIHSGITGLIDIVYNQGASTVLILDNAITGMTGHQENPATGKTLKGQPTHALSLEKLCEAVGVRHIEVVDPFDLKKLEQILKTEIARPEPSVVIIRRACALVEKKPRPPMTILTDKCRLCGMCLKIGCPCIEKKDGVMHIDPTFCYGCDLCQKLCRFDAIVRKEV